VDPEAILFDLDGTLVDDDYAVAQALLAAGLPTSEQNWRSLLQQHFGRYLAGEISFAEQRRIRVRALFAQPLADADADHLFAQYESAYRAAWRAFPDAAPALQGLERFPRAILTNGDSAQQHAKVQAAGLDHYFQGIYASSEIGFAKPAREAFLDACRRLPVEPSRSVYVGDDPEKDAQGSAAAGLRAIWLDRQRSGRRVAPGIRVIHSLAELLS
jgi:putative hydrolase of the HAD superfamily